MLRPFIIEDIREREERERPPRPQPFLDLPLDDMPMRESQEPEESDRGVAIIDLMGDEEEY